MNENNSTGFGVFSKLDCQSDKIEKKKQMIVLQSLAFYFVLLFEFSH